MSENVALRERALDYAEMGYHVFPCRPRSKRPMTKHGFKDATTDERQIHEWWDECPDANIGIACGASGIAVVDIDSKHGADPARLLVENPALLNGPLVLTGAALNPAGKWTSWCATS